LIDTAGRMHTSKNLMAEIEKIARVCKPDLKIFVGESITGNDIIEQVKTFDWHVHIDGIILSKADIDEKGGTALSVGYITKKPILFLGTGQEYDKIEPFDKEKFIEKLGLD
jgi:fused signal recognition particle receptor